MHPLPLLLPFLLTLSLATLSSEECEKKGFGSSLLCSSCDKLASFVGDSEIVEECQLCCENDESEVLKKVKHVTLQTNPFYEGRLPEVSDFIKKYKDRYEGFQVNTRVSIASARLVMMYENGKSEIVNLDGWKSDRIRDFCDSILQKAK